jgi:lipopolysaccharide transport system ATP-binding protein
MRLAISVEGVGKRYALGELHRSTRLSERLTEALRRGHRASAGEDFWALRDVSLTIDAGQVVGLIGPNGAGKSTLLKLMARITAPTTGRIVMRGRVGTLLEVGTGFHPELTGRENVFLNGSILGLSRRDIAARFDQIVDYAGVERFIDTPVKRYSSGMYVRLAFAVAAHLDPDVLLVDEVLSVGDAEFQRKCIGTLREASSGGRTVVFVSHSMEAVRSLCSHAYLVEQGQIVTDGPSDYVIRHYLDRHRPPVHEAQAMIPPEMPRVGGGQARFRGAAVLGAEGHPVSVLHLGEPVALAATIEVLEPVADAVFEFGLSTADGVRIATVHSIDEGRPAIELKPGRHEIRVDLDVGLIPGEYGVDLGVSKLDRGETVDLVDRVLRVEVRPDSLDGSEQYPVPKPRGFVRPRSDWSVVSSDAIHTSPARP